MSKSNWDKKLEKGEVVENKILKKIQIKYPKAYKMEGNFKYYDFMIPEINKKIEVKNDIDSEKHGNYFIEISCNYQNSGIVATKADYWCIYDEADVVWIKTSALKAVCDIQGRYWRGVPKGESSEVEAWIIPKELLKKQSFKIENGSKYEL